MSPVQRLPSWSAFVNTSFSSESHRAEPSACGLTDTEGAGRHQLPDLANVSGPTEPRTRAPALPSSEGAGDTAQSNRCVPLASLTVPATGSGPAGPRRQPSSGLCGSEPVPPPTMDFSLTFS